MELVLDIENIRDGDIVYIKNISKDFQGFNEIKSNRIDCIYLHCIDKNIDWHLPKGFIQENILEKNPYLNHIKKLTIMKLTEEEKINFYAQRTINKLEGDIDAYTVLKRQSELRLRNRSY